MAGHRKLAGHSDDAIADGNDGYGSPSTACCWWASIRSAMVPA